MAFFHLLVFLCLSLLIPTNSHNITAILEAFPQYSVYNSYLSQTKVCDEINSHEKVTSLVLSNPVMSSFVAKHSPEGIKNALRHLSLLDYFDLQRLHNLTRGTTLTATLYRSPINVPGSGYMRITELRGGRVGFALAIPGSVLHPTLARSVVQIPNNLSVLEISAPINFRRLPGPLSAASNLMDLLEQAGCKIFASLISSSGVLAMYRSAMDKGFTLFAPTDDAFKAPGAPDLTTLSRIDLVRFLQYHALPSYNSEASLKTTSGPIATMASNVSAEYNLSVIAHGDDVFLNTGVGTARVASTVADDTHVCVITVESLLLPTQLFGGAPAPVERDLLTLTPIPASSTAPAPVAEAPGSLEQPDRRPKPKPGPPNRPSPPSAPSPPLPRTPSPPPPSSYSPPPPPSPDVPSPDVPLPDVPSPDVPSPDHPPSPCHCNNGSANLVFFWDVSIASVIYLFVLRL